MKKVPAPVATDDAALPPVAADPVDQPAEVAGEAQEQPPASEPTPAPYWYHGL